MYRNILFATDFSPEAAIAEKKAAEVAELNSASLSVIHVTENFTNLMLEDSMSMKIDIEKMLIEDTQRQMASCSARIPLKLKTTHICSGSPKRAICNFAENIDADLIVIGSHGRHGLELLLGSTANGVLHAAKCDVLAIRVKH